jgi:hypothetical protein
MLKKWTIGIILLSTSFFTQATLINSNVTGADMAGIEITAFFGDGTQDTQVWSALSSTSGGVSTNAWSLMLDGNTFGDFDSATGTLYGDWTLNNLSVADGIIGLTVNASIADFYFDIIPGTAISTPGSEAGRPFAATIGSATASFSDAYGSQGDLFGIMAITGFDLNVADSLVFLTDTDKAEIPEPSTMFTFALGLIALTSLRKKSSGKR